MENLNQNEKELVELMNHFSKRAASLHEAGMLGAEYEQVTSACNNLSEQLYAHAAQRQLILNKREQLMQVVQDQASCPNCKQSDQLERTGEITNESGWKVNQYHCNNCGTSFDWGRPNNPWDMVQFLEQYISQLNHLVTSQQLPQEMAPQTQVVIAQLNESLQQLKPTLEGSDAEFSSLQEKDKEMSKVIQQFKDYLLAEKAKMDVWQDQQE